jgi:hypothetical protein
MKTEADFLEEMERCARNGDEEIAHNLGDRIVSDALRHLGWYGLADAYDEARANWWYA